MPYIKENNVDTSLVQEPVPVTERVKLSAKCMLSGIRNSLRFLFASDRATLQFVQHTDELQKKLEVSNEHYSELVEHANIGIVIDDFKGQLVYFNENFCTMLGLTADEINGRTVLDLLHPEDKDRVTNIHNARVRGDDAVESYECRFMGKEGTVYVEVHAARKKYGIQGTRSFLIDKTKEREAELEVIKLRGTPSVCSQCKKIRLINKDGEEKWLDYDMFYLMSEGAYVSHGSCPTCAEEQRQEILRLFGPNSDL